MTENVIGYGIHFEPNEDFINENMDLIQSIIDKEENLHYKDRFISLIGGGNWDTSYFFGIYIDSRDETALSLDEINAIILEKDYKHLFQEKISQYPEFKILLEPFKNYISGKIILYHD